MKKIIIYCSGGLSNRIFPVASGIEFAKMTGRELFIYWPVDRICTAKFNELYKDKLNVIDEDFLNSLNDQETEYHSRYIESVDNDYNLYHRSFFKNKLNSGKVRINEIVKDSDVTNICFYSNTFMRIIPNKLSEKNLRNLEIVDDCKQSIENFTKELGLNKNIIGAHVRGTDFDKNIEYYVNLIKNTLEYPEQRIFISSDDVQYETALFNIFPNNIFFRKNKKYVKKYNPNASWDNNTFMVDVETMKDAIIDLYLLSKTNLKIYDPRSSYSYYARVLS